MTGAPDVPAPPALTLANVCTFARFALAPVCAAFYLQGSAWAIWLAGSLAGVAMLSDAFDGYFARRNHQVSDLGRIFDPLADAVFFLVVWTALALAGAFPIWLVLPFIAREYLQHVYLRPVAARRGLVLAAMFWGKLKTVLQTIALIAISLSELAIRYWPAFEVWGRGINLGLISATALVSLLSLAPYIRAVARAGR
jgi:CDP-diacylglycerol---glycerol-3-phosphate 3-phosphatidyltransferase